MPDSATAEKEQLLRTSSPFQDFEQDVIDRIVPLLTPCSFEKDNLICLKGDESDCLYIIREGQIEVSISSRDGKIILLGYLKRGHSFGEVGLLDGGSRTANVIALTDVSAYRLESADFDKVAQSFGKKEWMAVSSNVCSLFRNVTNNLEETVFLDGSIRVARKLLTMHERSDEKETNSFTLKISQENLGRMVSLSREATNKALAKLGDQGLIQSEYKAIVISDVAALKNLTEQDGF